MELWTYWLSAIQCLLNFLSSQAGLGEGLGIVALTVLLRTMILPLSWRVAYRGCIRQKKMVQLQPELARLKLELGDEPRIYAERMMKLYIAGRRQRRSISLDRNSIASGSLVCGVGGTHDDADDGCESGSAGTNASDADSSTQHFGRRRSAEVLFGVGGLLDGFQLLFGGPDRCSALCGGETHQVGCGVDLELDAHLSCRDGVSCMREVD